MSKSNKLLGICEAFDQPDAADSMGEEPDHSQQAYNHGFRIGSVGKELSERDLNAWQDGMDMVRKGYMDGMMHRNAGPFSPDAKEADRMPYRESDSDQEKRMYQDRQILESNVTVASNLLRICEGKMKEGDGKAYQAYKDKLMKEHGYKDFGTASKDAKFMKALDDGWKADVEGSTEAVDEAMNRTNTVIRDNDKLSVQLPVGHPAFTMSAPKIDFGLDDRSKFKSDLVVVKSANDKVNALFMAFEKDVMAVLSDAVAKL